jgi:hypothetical protein
MRDNKRRTSAAADPAPEVVEDTESILNFTVPTELVDLPTKGRYYPEGHPLCGKDTIEIKYMTAKDEDILTSPSLLKKGLAIERFLQNVILDNRVKVGTLLAGDKQAIMIASRINGFGEDYTTKVGCPSCGSSSENTFNLSDIETYEGNDLGEYDVVATERGTFVVKLPRTGVEAEIRLLTAGDEDKITVKMMESQKRKNSMETNLTDQLRMIIVSVNGSTEMKVREHFIDTLPAYDSRYLRAAYARLVPAPIMKQQFECSSCGYEEEVDIPMTVDFFWTRQ